MSKKKAKTKLEKQVKKHNFSHLVKTKTAAKIVEAKIDTVKDAKSPLDKEISHDLKTGVIVIAIFILVIMVIWFLFGKNGEIFRLSDKIKLF